MATTLTEAQITEQQISHLIRGELDGGTIDYTYVSYPWVGADAEDKSGTFRYHYTGVPEWCASDYADLHSNDCDYFTAVRDCLFGLPPEEIVVGGKSYARGAHYSHSGETECVYRSGAPEDDVVTAEQCNGPTANVCPYCEADVGDDHGYINIGDGWCEVVYRHDAIQAMRDLAASHNLQVWTDSAITFECQGTCNDDLTFPLTVVNDQPHRGCPICGEAFEGGKIVPSRWWWQTCSPGCLPDSDVMGPFDDEIEALEDATEGLAD